MKLEKVMERCDSIKGGTYHSVEWRKTLKNTEVHKEFRNRIVKETIGVYRIGVCYNKMKCMVGQPTQSLPWGQWLKDYENYIIINKDKAYLRLTLTMNGNKPKTKWYLDGVETSKEELIQMNALASSQLKPLESPIFVVDIENIVSF